MAELVNTVINWCTDHQNELWILLAVLVAVAIYTTVMNGGNKTHSWFSLFRVNRAISDVSKKAESYTNIHEEGGGSAEDRAEQNQEMVDNYYSLATDFYLFGWGESFHFAPRYSSETHWSSLIRHEHYLAGATGCAPGDLVLDVGCGVGGPARNIARCLDTKVVGITINEYQVQRGTEFSKEQGLLRDAGDDNRHGASVDLVQGDFFHMPFEDNSFDGAYTIEATCHAADRVACYAEVLRVLKPGAKFVGYEWCLTDKYDPDNAEHRALKAGIEIGNGLPDIISTSDVERCLEEAGFELDRSEDLTRRGDLPWFQVFLPILSWDNIKTHPISVQVTAVLVWVLEALWIAPKGTTLMHRNLIRGLETLRDGGMEDIFTPCFFFAATKPMTATPAKKAARTPASGKRSKSPSIRKRSGSRSARRS